MYKLDFQKVSIVGALLLALLALYVALSATTAPAPVAPVASTQSFACAPGTMCVQYGGKQVDILSGGSFNINAGAVFTVDGVTASGVVRYGTGTVISGTTIAHGIGTTPTVFLLNNDGIRAATFTQTLYHGACDVTSCTVYLTQGSITTTVVDWIAGK